jgi:hypothetical protein
MTMHQPARLASLLLAFAACGDGSRTAVQLVLTPDPTVSPLSELLQQVDRVQVIVDGKDGVAGVTAAGPQPGGGTALDSDGDGVLEVMLGLQLSVQSSLPVLEIGLEANAGRALDFRILGVAKDGDPLAGPEQAVAAGGVSARVPRGEVHQVGTPFNLTPRARPPRVLLVLPADGAEAPYTLRSFIAVLSTTVREQSLAGNVSLIDESLSEPVPGLKTKLETLVVAGSAYGREERSLLTVDFPALPDERGFRIQIGPGIESTVGRRFDQDPSTSSEDAFVSRFHAPRAVGGGMECKCPDGYRCHDTIPLACVPIVSCSSGCGGGLVCDAQLQQCVEDCRTFNLCFDTKATCDPATGLCR